MKNKNNFDFVYILDILTKINLAFVVMLVITLSVSSYIYTQTTSTSNTPKDINYSSQHINSGILS